ncbi:MAG: creatininase family protein [Pseudomonadota bacterium]
MNSVWLQNLTWEEIQEKIKSSNGTIIVPIGSTEQHGPHLPVGNDTTSTWSIVWWKSSTCSRR